MSIERRTKENEQVKRQGAINALRQEKHQLTQGIYDQLCRIFIAEQNLVLRHSIVGLQDATFFDAARRLDPTLLNSFIDTETDPKLLQEFVRLIRVCTDADKNNYAYGTALLLRLLDRQTKALTEDLESVQSQLRTVKATDSPLEMRANAMRFLLLPESLLIDAISILANIADQDILKQVVQSLDPRKDIPSPVQLSLKALEANFKQNLIELLVERGFISVSQETWKVLLRDRDYEQLMGLWERIIQQKQQKAAQDVLIALLQLPQILDPQKNQEQNPVLTWLNGPAWDAIDQTILNAVKAANRRLVFQLQRLVDTDKQDRVADIAFQPQPPTVPASSVGTKSAPSTAASPTPATGQQQVGQYKGNAWLVTLSALTIIAIYFIVPFDIPPNATLLTHYMIRLLEALYVYGAIGFLLCFLFVMLIKETRAFFTGAVFIVGAITGAFFLAQIHFFPFTPTGTGQAWLAVLLMLIVITPIVVYYLTRKPLTTGLSGV